MNIQRFLDTAIRPALKELYSLGISNNREAERFMLAIALQESRVQHRKQLGSQGLPTGPANSYWQFESGGGVKGVLSHRSTADKIKTICQIYDVNHTQKDLWEAMRYHDIVAACAARLLIYTIPNALPTTAEEGWSQYISAWRPGRPHPSSWNEFWKIADEATNR